MSLTEQSAPSAEPITLAQAKEHLKVDFNDEDSYINSLISAARIACENITGQRFIQRNMRLTLDAFPLLSDTDIVLPVAPVQSITSITYIDQEGVEQTWSDSLYTFAFDPCYPRLRPAYNQDWPSNVRDDIAVININFVAGYFPDDASPQDYAASVPEAIKHALKLIIGHYYEHRMDAGRSLLHRIPFSASSLLNPYKIRAF